MPLEDLAFSMINRKGLTLKLELRGYMNISHPGIQISKPGYLKQRMKLNPAAFVDLYYLKKEELPQFDIYEVAESDLVAVMSKDNPLAGNDSLSYGDLDGKDIIFFQSDGVSFGLFSSDIKSSNVNVNTVMSSSQWHLIFDLAESGHGITIAPYYIYDKLRNTNLAAIPFNEPSSKRTIALITKKEESRSKALSAFIDFASNKDQYKDLIYHMKTI